MTLAAAVVDVADVAAKMGRINATGDAMFVCVLVVLAAKSVKIDAVENEDEFGSAEVFCRVTAAVVALITTAA